MILGLNIGCAVLYVAGLWLVSRKTWHGWLLLLFAQLLWLPLTIHWTMVQGWDVAALWVAWIGATSTAAMGVRKWRREK